MDATDWVTVYSISFYYLVFTFLVLVFNFHMDGVFALGFQEALTFAVSGSIRFKGPAERHQW